MLIYKLSFWASYKSIPQGKAKGCFKRFAVSASLQGEPATHTNFGSGFRSNVSKPELAEMFTIIGPFISVIPIHYFVGSSLVFYFKLYSKIWTPKNCTAQTKKKEKLHCHNCIIDILFCRLIIWMCSSNPSETAL